jgi:hypothetical protein
MPMDALLDTRSRSVAAAAMGGFATATVGGFAAAVTSCTTGCAGAPDGGAKLESGPMSMARAHSGGNVRVCARFYFL